jgi:hypothetical protein
MLSLVFLRRPATGVPSGPSVPCRIQAGIPQVATEIVVRTCALVGCDILTLSGRNAIVAALWEPRMGAVDELLTDDALLETVYDAQGERRAQSRTRGRHQTPAEVVLPFAPRPACFLTAMPAFREGRRWRSGQNAAGCFRVRTNDDYLFPGTSQS